MSNILLVNNEIKTLNILKTLIKTEGYKVETEESTDKAQDLIKKNEYSLLITAASKDCDPDMSLVKLAQSEQPGMQIVIIVEADEQLEAKANDLKPFAVVKMPLKIDELMGNIQRAVDFGDKSQSDNAPSIQIEKSYQFDNIVSESMAMKSVCNTISQISTTDVSILLTGDPGSGRTTIANTIHENSKRSENDIVVIDCQSKDIENDLLGGAGKKGAVENAVGSTLFLKEVESLSMGIQEKLAGLLTKVKANGLDGVRVVASTSKGLEQLVERGNFHNDLYKTLKVIIIKIPSFSERTQDIMPTIMLILRGKLGDGIQLPKFAPGAIGALEAYPWNGNKIEMNGVVHEILMQLSGDTVTKDTLPQKLKY